MSNQSSYFGGQKIYTARFEAQRFSCNAKKDSQ